MRSNGLWASLILVTPSGSSRPFGHFGSRFFGRGTYSNNEKSGGWSYVAPRQNPTVEGFFENGNPSGEWKVVYNKKTYKGSLEELKKQVPKLNEFSF